MNTNALIILLVVALVSFVTAAPGSKLTSKAITIPSNGEGDNDNRIRREVRSFRPKAMEDNDDDEDNTVDDDVRRRKRRAPPKVIPDEELEENE